MSIEYNNYAAVKDFIGNTYTENFNKRKAQEKNAVLEMAKAIESAKTKSERAAESYSSIREEMRHELLSTALNGIYMTSLGNCMTFTENTKLIAENLTDTYIRESGGAFEVLSKMKGKTYLLNTIYEAVEEEVEDASKEMDKEDEDTHNNVDMDEKKEDMLEKLENEDDIEAAVNIITQRVCSAEEDFIKKNAEDKQKIEDIVSKMNERLQAVKRDPNVSEEEEQEIEQEASYENKRAISRIHNERPHTVFETFVNNLSSSIVRDESKSIRENYFTENGKLDIGNIIDATRCLYGFLEFVNTIQLEKVNESYIKKVIDEM